MLSLALSPLSLSGLAPRSAVSSSRVAAPQMVQSKSMPMMEAPEHLQGMVGNVDFDPLGLSSPNNIKWMREAELKHGRMSMLAITGVMVQSAGIHLPGNADISFANADWAMAPTTLPPAAWGQVLFFIGLAEGQTSAGLFDLWLGNTEKREPGNLGWGTQFLSKDKKAADKMRLKELKNGRLAMLAIMGVAFNHVIPGALPGCMYN
mmetsp:Transcript_3234/g.9706  ORF Transcript_3234/g.9706 Transcript_3234/m.9706 type:complete len:206 (+) Transcript_3234:47-664(+)